VKNSFDMNCADKCFLDIYLNGFWILYWELKDCVKTWTFPGFKLRLIFSFVKVLCVTPQTYLWDHLLPFQCFFPYTISGCLPASSFAPKMTRTINFTFNHYIIIIIIIICNKISIIYINIMPGIYSSGHASIYLFF